MIDNAKELSSQRQSKDEASPDVRVPRLATYRIQGVAGKQGGGIQIIARVKQQLCRRIIRGPCRTQNHNPWEPGQPLPECHTGLRVYNNCDSPRVTHINTYVYKQKSTQTQTNTHTHTEGERERDGGERERERECEREREREREIGA
jgi:hypothetical protein